MAFWNTPTYSARPVGQASPIGYTPQQGGNTNLQQLLERLRQQRMGGGVGTPWGGGYSGGGQNGGIMGNGWVSELLAGLNQQQPEQAAAPTNEQGQYAPLFGGSDPVGGSPVTAPTPQQQPGQGMYGSLFGNTTAQPSTPQSPGNDPFGLLVGW